jgi:uncharacterized membrane-anchored protein
MTCRVCKAGACTSFTGERMQKKILLVGFCLMLLGWSVVNAAETAPESQEMTVEEFVASLNFQRGQIVLPGGMASMNIPESFRYLDPSDAERVLVQGWGNPSGAGTLGMLFPSDVGIVSENSWGVVITYEADGYVSDEDADSIDYDDLLKTMKEQTVEENKERQKLGYESIELVDWAAAPFYDKTAHKLYWAKEIAFGQEIEHTLNYNIRVLGREGVLVLNAVSSINQFNTVERQIGQVLEFTDFNPGYQYAEFDAKTDKKAAYGLAALVAGGVAAKAGLFTKLFAGLLAAKKLIFAGVIALGAFLSRMFKKNK